MTLNNKTVLRKKFKNIRNELEERIKKEEIIFDFLMSFTPFENADTIFAYAATGSEVNTDKAVLHALVQGKKVACPVCIDENGSMEFYYINGLDDLKNGMYSIREPDVTKCLKATYTDKTLCLVPGVCFDENGGRIGYGKGYYDRFMQMFSGTTVGISFQECIVKELIVEPHDKKVTYLITDKKIYNFRE